MEDDDDPAPTQASVQSASSNGTQDSTNLQTIPSQIAETPSINNNELPASHKPIDNAAPDNQTNQQSVAFQQPSAPAQQPQSPVVTDAFQKLDSGDLPGARQEVAQGLQQNPGDRQLQAVNALLNQRVSTPWTSDSLKRRIAGLGSLQDAGSAPDSPQVELASPISWPGMAASRGPAVGGAPQSSLAAKDALAQLRVGDYSGAQENLTLAIDRSHRWQDYLARALARRGLHDLNGAIDDAGHAIALNPPSAWPYNVRAQTLNDLHRPQEALEDVKNALRVNPRDGTAYLNKAQAEAQLGMAQQSQADLQKAAELDPSLADLARQGFRPDGSATFAQRWQKKTTALYLGAVGLALFLLALAIFGAKRSGLTSAFTARQAPMRQDDRLARTLAPGGRVRDFEIVRKLGAGGMGVVYEAMDLSLMRKVALKQMRAEIAESPRERRRFVKEARTVAALKHPNIIEIYSMIEESERLFLAFEYLDGETLDQALGRSGRLPPSQALRTLGQVARALDHAHAAGVVHQDLKPSNILLSGGTAKVMDFGIARRVQETLSTLSNVQAMGTPAYMAPEQEMGLCEARSDVYALGVCAYELLAGRRPERHGRAPLPSAPPAADAAVAAALSVDPAGRPPSAGAFVKTLALAFGSSLS